MATCKEVGLEKQPVTAIALYELNLYALATQMGGKGTVEVRI